MSTGQDFDKEREQREWEAQEDAVRAERAGVRAADSAVAQYRLIARALRSPPLEPLPGDFAARTAALVERKSRLSNERVEVWLGRGLVTLLMLAGAAIVAVYNGESLRELASIATSITTLPEPTVFRVQTLASWVFAIAACVGLSAAFTPEKKR